MNKTTLALILTLVSMSAFASGNDPVETPSPKCTARALNAYQAVHKYVLKTAVTHVKVISTQTAQDGAASQWSFRISGNPATYGNGKMPIESVVNMSYDDCDFEEFIRFPEHNG